MSHVPIPIPDRMKHLPVDPVRNVPIPWFVATVDGRREFRVADADNRALALALNCCWVCGYGIHQPPFHFVLGPMCGLNRISAEPAMHRECAEYSLKACPFLTRPRLERRPLPAGLQEDTATAGHMIARNPGAMALWSTLSWSKLSDGAGGILLRVGDPVEVSWWSEGRPATRAEVLVSIVTGVPFLIEAGMDRPGWEFLAKQWVALDRWLPV